MLKLKVRYFLNKQGAAYFPSWFNEVLKATQIQDGFIGLKYEIDSQQNTPVVYLDFKNQETLDKWRKQDTHQELVNKITSYFTFEPEVEINKDA